MSSKISGFGFGVRIQKMCCCNLEMWIHLYAHSLKYTSDGISGKIPFFKTPTGTESDMNYLFAMRENMVHYVHLIDIYAPCIVGRSNWNNTTNMVRF